MTDEVLTIEETAEFLKLSAQTVRQLLKRGELPGRRIGKQWRTTKRALLEFIDGKGDRGEPKAVDG